MCRRAVGQPWQPHHHLQMEAASEQSARDTMASQRLVRACSSVAEASSAPPRQDTPKTRSSRAASEKAPASLSAAVPSCTPNSQIKLDAWPDRHARQVAHTKPGARFCFNCNLAGWSAPWLPRGKPTAAAACGAAAPGGTSAAAGTKAQAAGRPLVFPFVRVSPYKTTMHRPDHKQPHLQAGAQRGR